jgi:release factor glutamine methyltransferase
MMSVFDGLGAHLSVPLGIGEILRQQGKLLEASLNLEAGTARIEVQCLMQAVIGVNRAYLLTHPERLLSDNEYQHFRALFNRRLQGEPIAYLLGMREFYGLDFKVTPATLIPRHDTELLVELALQRTPQNACLLDMGTGSGAIALSIAHARPDVEVVAVDASPAALDVARENVARLNVLNVKLLQSDWFAALAGKKFDLIVSNPPYIAVNDFHLGQGDVRFEPLSALVSGVEGLDDIRRIVRDAPAFLHTGGRLLLEHGYDQATHVRQLLEQAGFIEVASFSDLSGIERVSMGRIA